MSAHLSVAIVARDAARTLDRVLASVSWADEVVLVLDPRTMDATRDIARSRGARVLEHPWAGYVAQKNVALDAARNDWVLCLDADEEVSSALAQEIVALRAGAWSGAHAGYDMPRRSFYLNRWIRHSGWSPDRKLRLVHRPRARWGGVDPHDRLEVRGTVGHLEGPLHHYTYAGVAEHLARSEAYSTVAARALYAVGRRATIWDVVVRPPWHFVRSYVLRGGILDGFAGFVIASVGAAGVLAKYLKLRDLASHDAPTHSS